MNIAKKNQRMTRMTAAFFVVLVIILLALTSYADLGAIPAPTATPIQQPVATPLYIHMEWGQEMYVVCSQSSESEPAGQISLDLLGAEVLHGDCNPPGTVKGE